MPFFCEMSNLALYNIIYLQLTIIFNGCFYLFQVESDSDTEKVMTEIFWYNTIN